MINIFKKNKINKKQNNNSTVPNKNVVNTTKVKNSNKKVAIKKQEQKELFNGFNRIIGYIPTFNIIINEFNDYIAMVQCKSFNSANNLINNMQKYSIKEVQIFTHKKNIYCSIRYENNFKNVVKKDKYIDTNLKNELEQIKISLDEISKNNEEFRIVKLVEMFNIIREKVFREDVVDNEELKNIIFSKRRTKIDFQNKINAKKVNINNDYIIFNYDKNNENNNIYHKVLGLQLYPSYLYEGYLSEINYVKGVQTCTYIQYIDREKIKEKLKNVTNGELKIIKDYIEKVNNLYLTCFFIHIYGKKEEVEKTKDIILKISNKYNIHLNEFNKQQKRAYDAFLPLMNNKIKCYRQIDDISGIFPQNDEIIKYFKNGLLYGKELNAGSEFYFNRIENGIVLSSNNASKSDFLYNEKNFLRKKGIEIVNVSFKLDKLNYYAKDIDFYKSFQSKEFDNYNLNDYQIYIIFKCWLFLCLSQYKDKNYIELNDKETLNNIFEKIEKLFMYNNNDKLDNIDSILESMKTKNIIYKNTDKGVGFIDRVLNYIKENNKKLYDHIIEKYNKPTNDLKLIIAGIYKLIETTSTNYERKNAYMYIPHIEEIVFCLNVLFDYFFSYKFNNKYMFYSYNDFLLLNDDMIAKNIFKSNYINIIDISSSDLVKINNYVYLSNNDIAHLNNKTYIAGRLITNVCEFNYYNEKVYKGEEI